MQEKISLAQAVIVEGKYDKIHLESMLDAVILTTGGFHIFRDKEMRAFIRKLAHSCGIVVLTDSDAAGFKIRACVNEIARGGQVTQVYIPDVMGKERRKEKPGKEGKLGVEAINLQVLREAFQRAGLSGTAPQPQWLDRQALYELGLTGGPGSSTLRRALLRKLELPERLSTTALLPVVSRMLTPEQLLALVEELQEAAGQ